MKNYASILDVIKEIYPLHRTLASEGTDRALEIVGEYMPDAAGYSLETYAPLTPVWTWKVPERYVVHAAYLVSEDGRRLIDFADNPLHLVSYSLPTDCWVTFEQLEPHLYYNAKRPAAIPWMFKYYERSWGFCLSKDAFDRLPRHQRFHAVIDVEFVTDPAQGFKIGVGVVHPQGGKAEGAPEFRIDAVSVRGHDIVSSFGEI